MKGPRNINVMKLFQILFILFQLGVNTQAMRLQHHQSGAGAETVPEAKAEALAEGVAEAGKEVKVHKKIVP